MVLEQRGLLAAEIGGSWGKGSGPSRSLLNLVRPIITKSHRHWIEWNKSNTKSTYNVSPFIGSSKTGQTNQWWSKSEYRFLLGCGIDREEPQRELLGCWKCQRLELGGGGVAWVCMYVKVDQAPHLDLYTLLTSHRIPQWKIDAFQSPPQTAGLPFVLFPDEETQCFLERYRMFLSHPLITTRFVSEGKALDFLQGRKWFSVLCSVGAASCTQLLNTWNWLIWNEMHLEGRTGAGKRSIK